MNLKLSKVGCRLSYRECVMKPERKKIYFINDMPFSLGFGGKEIQLLKYKEFLSPQYDVILLNNWDSYSFSGNEYFHLFGSGKWFHNIIGQIKQKCPSSKIVISPTIYYADNSILRIANKLSRLFPFNTQFDYKRYIFDNSDVIVPNSFEEATFIKRVWGKKLDSKICVVHNSVDENFGSECHRSFSTHYGMESNFILSVGFLDERKNSINLLKAFNKTLSLHTNNLVLIGGERFINPSNRAKFENLKKQAGDRIIHIPYVNHESGLIQAAYNECIFHVLPSYVETPGLANLEAGLNNKPLLVGDCKPVREYFGKNVYYCNPGNVDNISSMILQLLDNGYKNKLNIRQFVLNNYSDYVISSKLNKLYESL